MQGGGIDRVVPVGKCCVLQCYYQLVITGWGAKYPEKHYTTLELVFCISLNNSWSDKTFAKLF